MKITKNKKSISRVLAGLIILVAVAIVLIIFVLQTNKEIGRMLPKQLCMLSVEIKSNEKLLHGGMETESYLNCHTNYITINKEGILFSNEKVKNGEEIQEVDFKKTNKDPDELIKKYLADELYDCWDQFGQGKVDFLTNYDWLTSNARCFPCAKIYFEDSFLKGFTFGDWEDYLTNNKHDSGVYYKDFLTWNNTQDIYTPNTKNKRIYSNKGDVMYIIFRGGKDWSTNSMVTGILANVFSFVTSYSPTIESLAYLTRPETVEGTCDRLY